MVDENDTHGPVKGSPNQMVLESTKKECVKYYIYDLPGVALNYLWLCLGDLLRTIYRIFFECKNKN